MLGAGLETLCLYVLWAIKMINAEIPILGLGTYGRTGSKGANEILEAISIGYRHLDTAQTYNTESTVGDAVRRSGIAREKFFITTKVADYNLEKSKFLPSVELSLDTIGLGAVDLLLIHWPSPREAVPLEHYLEALAVAQQRGLARFIGVSNFTNSLMERAIAILGKGAVATNQVEIHPYLQAPKLCAHAKILGIQLTAYQPLAQGRVANDSVLNAIAENHKTTASAISLAFLMTEGHIVIPASSKVEHLRDNFSATSVQLLPVDIARIERLERGMRVINPAMSPKWDD